MGHPPFRTMSLNILFLGDPSLLTIKNNRNDIPCQTYPLHYPTQRPSYQPFIAKLQIANCLKKIDDSKIEV